MIGAEMCGEMGVSFYTRFVSISIYAKFKLLHLTPPPSYNKMETNCKINGTISP